MFKCPTTREYHNLFASFASDVNAPFDFMRLVSESSLVMPSQVCSRQVCSRQICSRQICSSQVRSSSVCLDLGFHSVK